MRLHFTKDKLIKLKLLLNEKRYPVDFNYQREPEAWSYEDEQYFIDSLPRKFLQQEK